MRFVFAQLRKFSARIRWWTQNICWLPLSLQDLPIVIKLKYLAHIVCFGVVTSDSDVMPPFIFPHSLWLNMEACVKRLAAGRPYIWQQDCIMPHKQENSVLATWKFLQPHYANIWHLRLQSSWIYEKHGNTKDEQKASLMTAFTNIN